jgi:hypothetical protein
MRAKYDTWLYEEAELTATVHCDHCGADQEAVAKGTGYALFDHTAARSRAARQASGLMAVAPCPSCGRRAWGGWLRLVVWGGLKGLWNTVIALLVIGFVSSCLPDALTASCSQPLAEPVPLWAWGPFSMVKTTEGGLVGWILIATLYGVCVYFPVRRRLRLARERVRMSAP